jgi:hypothetical protein
MEAVTGRYENDEIGGAFNMSVVNGILRVSNNANAEGLQFTPVSRDIFQLSQITIRFIRDKSGKVTALDFSNPLVKNILFVKAN